MFSLSTVNAIIEQNLITVDQIVEIGNLIAGPVSGDELVNWPELARLGFDRQLIIDNFSYLGVEYPASTIDLPQVQADQLYSSLCEEFKSEFYSQPVAQAFVDCDSFKFTGFLLREMVYHEMGPPPHIAQLIDYLRGREEYQDTVQALLSEWAYLPAHKTPPIQTYICVQPVWRIFATYGRYLDFHVDVLSSLSCLGEENHEPTPIVPLGMGNLNNDNRTTIVIPNYSHQPVNHYD